MRWLEYTTAGGDKGYVRTDEIIQLMPVGQANTLIVIRNSTPATAAEKPEELLQRIKAGEHEAGDFEAGVGENFSLSDEDRTPNVGDDVDAEPRRDVEDQDVSGLAAAEAQVRDNRVPRIAKSLAKLREQVNQMAPRRNKASDGWIGDPAHQRRDSDHNPWIVDGTSRVVSALDITHDPSHGCDANRIAESIRESRDPRVKYIIWNRRIVSSEKKGRVPAWQWRRYSGANPHTKHVHISVKSEKARYDDPRDWDIR